MGALRSEDLLNAPVSKIPGSTGWFQGSSMTIPIPNITGGAATSAPSGYNQFGSVYTYQGGGLWSAVGFIALAGVAVYLWKKK